MQTRRIGDRNVSAIGLGAMPMSVRDVNDEERALATVRRALEDGVTLIDTADAYSPAFRSSEPEIDLCHELGLAFLAWSPLGGMNDAARLGEAFSAFAEVARERGVTPQQVCLAWELARSEVVVPIPGASRPESVADSVRAADLHLEPDELARLSG